jgi:HKD family nuclease
MLITNADPENNHFTRLRELADASDEITILSPFLSQDLQSILEHVVSRKVRTFHLITSLRREPQDQVAIAKSLGSLLTFFAQSRPDVRWSVSLTERLHGKVYLFFRRRDLVAAIISSANLTGSGLIHNQEWGWLCTESGLLAEILHSVSVMEIRTLTPQQIVAFDLEARKYQLKHPDAPQAALNLFRILGSPPNEHVTVWIKPSGVAEDPVRAGDTRYAKSKVRLRFSVRRPSGVHVGDLMVVYGVGAKQLMGLFEIISHPVHATPEELVADATQARWPWRVIARNLTPVYSATWWEYNLHLTALMAEYQSLYPAAPLTLSGGQTLGALNYGADKVRLASGFAAFLIEKVRAVEQAIGR